MLQALLLLQKYNSSLRVGGWVSRISRLVVGRAGLRDCLDCARSSTGQSTGLLSRGLQVRVLPGVPATEVAASMVGVAQLVELWIVVPVVVGSSPIAHPIFSRDNAAGLCDGVAFDGAQ